MSGPGHLPAPTLLGFVWSNRRALLPGLTFAMLRICSIAALPLIFKRIVDVQMPAKDVRGILWVSVLMVGLLVVHQYLSVRGGLLIGREVTRAVLGLRAAVFDKIQVLSFSYLDREKAGRLLAKYAFDTQKVDQTVFPMLNGFVPNIFYAVLTFGVLVAMDWQLAGVLVLMLPIFGIMRTRYFQKLRDRNEASRRAQERLSSEASEILGALRLVRSYGREERVRWQLHAVDADVARARVDAIHTSSSFSAFSWGSIQLLSLVVVAGGALLSIYGQVTPGTVLAFVAGLPALVGPVQMFANMADQYFVGRESYASLRELVDEGDVERWRGTQTLPSLTGRIEFDRVTFRYPGANRPALEDFSLTIEPGQSVALVGASGAGKSTIVSLLLGLYAPESGQIRIDGVPQHELDMRWLRSQTAIIMQENILLGGTVADNLRFARDDATDEQVHNAARRANAEDFILAMPDGYETLLGERGAKLSGGQRQRLAIARGLLRDPPILILDEPTSALDYASERLIQLALEELAQGRSVITIAHRLSTIRNADRVVVLEDGRVVEQGTFAGLARAGGAFTEMLRASRGDITEPENPLDDSVDDNATAKGQSGLAVEADASMVMAEQGSGRE